MMPDIFSTFDPHSSMSFMPSTTMFLLINVMLIIALKPALHLNLSRSYGSLCDATDIMASQLMRTGAKQLKGFSVIVTSTFILIILINLGGMIPYSFSLSSHLIMTLTLGLPLWMSLIISSFAWSPKHSTAHFLPDGAPDWLNPFLVLIETTSVLVRPLTLSFRLAANMTAGHIVLSLIGIYGASAILLSVKSASLLILVSSGYILFEFAICLIQAYIFCLLLSLYSDDHAN